MPPEARRLLSVLLLLTSAARVDSALCDAVAGLNCWGNDVTDAGVTPDASACCAACTAHGGCRAWTWDAAEGDPPQHCWLKSSCAGARADSQAVSGHADPLPPGPAPFLCEPRVGVNCMHNDIADAGAVQSPGECCAACARQAGCNAWSYNHPPGDTHCWLKTSCDGFITDATATSGAAMYPPPAPTPPPPLPPQPVPRDYHNGVSMGGWLVTEPSWMYDEFSAPAEADLVAALRAQGGDAFAVTTMRNHWSGYIPDAALDTLAAFGATHARIPVGYWIIESPVTLVPQADDEQRAARGGAYAYGFNHEGFVTGGLNDLEAMLAKLKARGIKALIDVHALPGGSSSCQSYAGWQVNAPLFWTSSPPASNATPVPAACGGAGPYRSSRGDARLWMAVGEDAILALGAWVVSLQSDASLSDTVVGLEVANEPGLGFGGVQGDIERLLTDVVPPLQSLLAAGGVSTNVTLNFIGPNDEGAGPWVAAQVQSGLFNASRLLIDFHEVRSVHPSPLCLPPLRLPLTTLVILAVLQLGRKRELAAARGEDMRHNARWVAVGAVLVCGATRSHWGMELQHESWRQGLHGPHES